MSIFVLAVVEVDFLGKALRHNEILRHNSYCRESVSKKKHSKSSKEEKINLTLGRWEEMKLYDFAIRRGSN